MSLNSVQLTPSLTARPFHDIKRYKALKKGARYLGIPWILRASERLYVSLVGILDRANVW